MPCDIGGPGNAAARAALPLLAAAALVVPAALAEVAVTQNLTLRRGWNAVYMEVQPSGSLDEVFADWPVDSVGFYDPAMFLSTRRFSSTWDSRGISMNPVSTWRRGIPEASRVQAIPAGTVCILFNTNGARTAVSVSGVPAAPRITWHVTDTNLVCNFVGVSLKRGESVSPMDYLEGFKGNYVRDGIYQICGNRAGESQEVVPLGFDDEVSDGDVILVASDLQCDWSGVLNVSPMNGLDFGEESSKSTLVVRNDGAEARTVSVALRTSPSYGDAELPRGAIHVRDAAVALTNAAWSAVGLDADAPIAERRLEPDETWKLEFGIDRPMFDTGVKGRSFGALLTVTDADGRSKMRVDVPMSGTTSGGSAASRAWPGGLWVAEAVLDRIVAPDTRAETETGGEAKIRLPIHVDADGKVRLLQRVTAAGTVSADGAFDCRLYAGTATVPETARQVMRVSAVCLPTETPVVESSGGTFSPDGVKFSFTVAGGGSTSILRHPLHPQHDGLRWDFKTPAPSGDAISNYKGDVKPETFSVENEISLSFDLDGGEAAWNPEQVKKGSVRWKMSGLMRQGPITLVGVMTVKRVSPQTELVLE